MPLRLNQADLRLPAAAWAGACAPHPTQGAAMALEDSVVLAEMLTSPSAASGVLVAKQRGWATWWSTPLRSRVCALRRCTPPEVVLGDVGDPEDVHVAVATELGGDRHPIA